ncbi:MAG: DUF2970 domain-containing protein [Aestuariibacter sp.]
MSKPSLWQVIKSVAASAFGVQSEANRQKDFEQSSILPYVLVGVVFVLGFIALLMLIVHIAIG